MDRLRDFPSYGWICKLSNPRYFSGSVGTQPSRGCLNVYTFEYRVWREEDSLHASCYIKPPLNSGVDPFGQDEMECSLSKENVEIVKNWIMEQMGKYSELIGK